jgi:hypothetical protein
MPAFPQPFRNGAVCRKFTSRQFDRKYGTFAYLAFYFDGTAMVFDNAINNRESETGASGLILGGEKWIEDLIYELGGNAAARIGDNNPAPRFVIVPRHQ